MSDKLPHKSTKEWSETCTGCVYDRVGLSGCSSVRRKLSEICSCTQPPATVCASNESSQSKNRDVPCRTVHTKEVSVSSNPCDFLCFRTRQTPTATGGPSSLWRGEASVCVCVCVCKFSWIQRQIWMHMPLPSSGLNIVRHCFGIFCSIMYS